jgi:hypothetical protein
VAIGFHNTALLTQVGTCCSDGLGLVLDHHGHAPNHYIWIEEVVEGTPAGAVGMLTEGDIVIAINGSEVRRLQMVDVLKLLVSTRVIISTVFVDADEYIQLQANNSITMHVQRDAALLSKLREKGDTARRGTKNGLGKKALFDARDIKQTLKVREEAEVEWRRASTSALPATQSKPNTARQHSQLSHSPRSHGDRQHILESPSERFSKASSQSHPSSSHPSSTPSRRASEQSSPSKAKFWPFSKYALVYCSWCIV